MQRCISSLWHTLFLCVVVVVCSSAARAPLPFLPSDQLIAVNCPHLQEAVWLSDVCNWRVAARSSWTLQACQRLRGTPPSYADAPLLCERCSRVWPEWMVTWHTGNDVKHWSLSVGLCSEVYSVLCTWPSCDVIWNQGVYNIQCGNKVFTSAVNIIHLTWALSFYFGPCPIY